MSSLSPADAEASHAVPGAARRPQAVDPMVPRPFRVLSRRSDTSDTFTLSLEPVHGPALRFRAGQFTMLSAFGVGEVPISISGDPTRKGPLLHTIRDVGGVTHALAKARRGDVLGVRGPLGHGWSVSDGMGGDIVVVAGGIGLAPLRPAVLEILSKRQRYGRLVLLYGTRSPDDVLFARDLEAWRGRFDFDVDITVDYGPPEWRGRVGLVTALIARAGFDPRNTLALACGPEIMMRRVASGLADRGVPKDRIRLSLERNMACGVGLCGHCQLREVFTCVDGPVLTYERVEPLMDLREV